MERVSLYGEIESWTGVGEKDPYAHPQHKGKVGRMRELKQKERWRDRE